MRKKEEENFYFLWLVTRTQFRKWANQVKQLGSEY